MTDTTLETPGAEQRAPLVRVATALAHRWPTWLGIAAAVAFMAGEDDGRALGVIVFIAALSYLTVAVLDRPRAAWLVVVAVTAAAMAIGVLGMHYALILGPAALVVAAVGLVRGQLRRPGLFALQAPAMLVFGTSVLAAEYASAAAGGTVVAAALFAHTIWDIVHWRANRVIARSLAEWCAVLDFLLGLGILALILL